VLSPVARGWNTLRQYFEKGLLNWTKIT